MSRVTIDVFHLDVRVPTHLPEATYAVMVKALGRRSLRRRLARMALRLLHRSPELETVTVRVSR